MLDFIVTYITKMITGLDCSCLKIWEIEDWICTYQNVELATKIVICILVVTIIASIIYAIGCKFIDLIEED